MDKKIPLIAVIGPTASGKTGLAVEIAKKFGGEVVSADSMQIYSELTIGTAKPTENEMEGIPHHLVGHKSVDDEYSVVDYVEEAKKAIADIHERGKLPVLCGGTGLYVDSLLSNTEFSEIKSDPEVRKKLFDFAKQELLRLSAGDAPFNLTMLTADTHFPDGYECRLCDDKHEEQYANVLSCSSKQVYDFVGWIKSQPFYENTTIVICGDHLSMDANFLEDIDENYVRTVYSCIINSAVSPISEKNRSYGTFDMFPTTLAALGVNIEGERLGLGTNLFSQKPTLCEEYGFEQLDLELQKKSDFYNVKFLAMEEE